jgi:altronate hydrolase
MILARRVEPRILAREMSPISGPSLPTAEPAPGILIRLHPDDDVAVARSSVLPGTELGTGGESLRAAGHILAGHKIALRPVHDGAPIRKYGQIIGFARGEIAPGDHVHSHNLVVKDLAQNYEFCADAHRLEPRPPEEIRRFQGFPRVGGRVGTRNYVAVISTVNCSASVARFVQERFPRPALARDFPQVDGVLAFTHKSGCGMATGEPHQLLMRVLAGMARHPNIAGYVLIGLGCEVNLVESLRQAGRLDRLQPGETPPTCIEIQHAGGVGPTVEAAAAAVTRLLPVADSARRQPQPVSRLILAENCGGSDAYSGLTANPALGVASDELVRQGGTSVLAETPEIYGAEHLLTRRAASREIGEQLLARIRWWEDHVRRHDASIDNNPSPGNKAGGLTTIYEKSLGAVAKGGRSPLMAVYRYAEPITAAGLCFMDTPGFDPVSMTGLVAGGCNVGVFTTGRGSVYGCKPVPCIKVASHTALFERMHDDMDLNAGTILDGRETVAEVGRRLFEKIVAVAGGEKTQSERAGIGDEEFAPWMLGPTF